MVTYQVVTMKRGGKDRQVVAEFDNGYDATQYATTRTFGRGVFVSVVRVEG